MSRFLHLRRLSRHLHSYLKRSKKCSRVASASNICNSSKFIVWFQTLRTVIMTDESENLKSSTLDIDKELQQALEDGDTALLNLIEQLKNFVVIISEEYRNCLSKQIEIMERASSAGPFSQAWDELPQYRTLADQLEKELNEYLTVFNTLGQMAGKKTLVNCVSGSNDKLDLVALKYQELEALLQKEIEDNKRVNMEFLHIKRDTILKEGSNIHIV